MSAPRATATTHRRAPLRLAFISAAAAAAHELVWARVLGRAVGNLSVGIAITLAMFMLGSGLGALLVARTRFWSRPRASYVRAELLIAFGSALVVLYAQYSPTPSSVFAWSAIGGQCADILVASLVTLPAALGIGATYPLLVELAPGLDARAQRTYAAGVLGAVFGSLFAALLVAPRCGLLGLEAIAGALNLGVALAATRVLAEPPPPAATIRERTQVSWALASRFGAAAALGLGAQSVWNRCVVPYAGVSGFAFAGIVAAYLAAQAVGFRVVRWLPPTQRARAGRWALALAGPVVLLGLGVLGRMPEPSARDRAALAWLVATSLSIVAAVGGGALLSGISQAAVLDELETREPGLGARSGRLTGVGTLASAFAAVAAAVIGLPLLGPRWTLALLAMAPALALLASRAVGLGLLTVLASLVLGARGPGPSWFLGPHFDAAPLLYAEHGVQDTSAVITIDLPVEPRTRHLVSNGVSYSGDSIYAQRYMRLLAHLPARAARERRRALLICIGTGTTLDALRSYPFEHIDAIDISPSIRNTLALFEHVNHGAARDPRVQLGFDDGARYLRRTRDSYDVITLEPPPPRAPGASTLYAREFYAEVRAHLRPGGAVAQWLPLHGLSGAEASAIVHTFSEAFPSASFHIAERNEAILVGTVPQPVAADVAAPSTPAAERDLGAIGFAGRDALRDTRVLEGSALAQAVASAPLLRQTWPMPEYAPLAGASAERAPLDAWLESLALRAAPEPGSSAALLLPALASFARVYDARERDGDREIVTHAMRGWLARQPDDPYLQAVFGFGPLLRARLVRLGRSLPAEQRTELEARMAAQATQLESLISGS